MLPILILCLLLVGLYAADAGASVLTERHAPGNRLVHAAQGADGVERVPLSALLDEASAVLGRQAEPEPLALAKMLKSEGDSDDVKTRRARAWVAWNDLQALNDGRGFEPGGFVELFQFSTSKAEKGYFGDQSGRRYASLADPYEGDYLDAESLLAEFADPANDPTGGATKFVDAGALGVQAGTEGKTIASVEAQWGMPLRRIDGTRAGFYVGGGDVA